MNLAGHWLCIVYTWITLYYVTASSCFLALRPPIFRLRRDFREEKRVLKDSANLSCEAPSNIIELLFYTVENIRSTSSHSQL